MVKKKKLLMISSVRLSSIIVCKNQSKHVHNSAQSYNEKHEPMENSFPSSISSLYFYAIIHKDDGVSCDVSILVLRLSQVMLSFY